MRFCAPHWENLRKAIDDRGLTAFIAKDGRTAVAQMTKQLEVNADNKSTFDPLMSAHWAIVNNVMRFIDATGNSPLYLIGGGLEEPVVGYPGYEGRTWPRCPLCYINLAHEVSCTDPECALDKTTGYDWMIDRAADDALARAREYGFVS